VNKRTAFFPNQKQVTIMAKTLVFIDSRINDKELLSSEFAPDIEYQVLDANRDGIDQIVTALSGQSGYDSIPIISHGASGSITIGSTVLNNSTLDFYAAELALIGNALTENGDLLLYGCNVAAGDQGQHFIESLSQMTGADVAASDDPTGGTVAGGDWVLEVQAAAVEQAIRATADGNFIIAGVTNSNASFTKVDATGTVLWSQSYCNGDFMSLEPTPDGGYVGVGSSNNFGSFRAKEVLVKTDGQGTQEWIGAYCGHDLAFGNSIAQTSDGFQHKLHSNIFCAEC
jgi:hypothetical protein